MDVGPGGGWFRMIQAHYISQGTLFLLLLHQSTIEHQALDPRDWGPRLRGHRMKSTL